MKRGSIKTLNSDGSPGNQSLNMTMNTSKKEDNEEKDEVARIRNAMINVSKRRKLQNKQQKDTYL